MNNLESWLKQATRGLSKDSAAQVRKEIGEHFEAALEAAMTGGASAEAAAHAAMLALGDAQAANCLYRRVLLTPVEARVLREGNWEARTFCARNYSQWLPFGGLMAVAAFCFFGPRGFVPVLAVAAIAMLLWAAARHLPVYTPVRGRIFRIVKWAALYAAFLVGFGAEGRSVPAMAIACAWPMIWVEWTRASIRRKLPVERWPKQLYL